MENPLNKFVLNKIIQLETSAKVFEKKLLSLNKKEFVYSLKIDMYNVEDSSIISKINLLYIIRLFLINFLICLFALSLKKNLKKELTKVLVIFKIKKWNFLIDFITRI